MSPGALGGDSLVVVDDLGDDEVQELLREGGVEMTLLGETAKPLDLLLLPLRVGRRETVCGFQRSDLLRELEPFREQVHESCVDVVDALPDAVQPLDRLRL